MKFMSTDDFFRGYRRLPSLGKARWELLEEDVCIEGICFAAGSEFKRWESRNFGYVVFRPESRTPEGWVPGRRIFRY